MDSTFAATPFFIAEPAGIKSFGSIIGEVVALRAQGGTRKMMVPSTIYANHKSHCRFFSFYMCHNCEEYLSGSFRVQNYEKSSTPAILSKG